MAQFPLNAGTQSALTELLRDHMLKCGGSHGQVMLGPYETGRVSLRSECAVRIMMEFPFFSNVVVFGNEEDANNRIRALLSRSIVVALPLDLAC